MRQKNMKNSIITIKPVTFIFSLLLATLVILLFYLMPSKTPNHSSLVMKDDQLQMALEKASMGNKEKTVIITVVNKAYVESDDESPAMFDLFLEGFWSGEGTRSLLGQLLVVSMDQTAHERCEFRRLNCYSLATGGIGGDEFSGEKVYMTDGFIEMMWRRTAFLLDVLNRGFSFIFTDTDVLWLRNPFTILSNNESIDLQISTSWYTAKHLINTGFYFVRSNERTISLFETWYDTRKNATGKKEQDVLEDLIKEGVLEKLGLNTKFLETLFFSGFCQDSRDVGRVATVHANCCKGMKAKADDLKMVLMAWNSWFKDNYNYRTSTDFQWPMHTSCINSGLLRHRNHTNGV